MEIKREGYYDLPDVNVEELLIESGSVDGLFYIRDLRQRKLFLDGDIELITISDTVRHILQYNKEDAGIAPTERKPILLYISSNGGDVDAGFQLIDVIRSSKTPVYTINLGAQYSMGFLIGLAGHKRFATPHAKFLMHDGSALVFDSGAKVKDQMKFQDKVDERIKEYVLSRSHLTAQEYDDKFRVEWYMFADEAKEKGFTDYIIGVDCDIDEVI